MRALIPAVDRRRLGAYAVIVALLLLVTVILPPAFDDSGLAPAGGTTTEGTVIEVLESEVRDTSNGEVRTERVLVRLDAGAGAEEVIVERVFVEGGVGAFDVSAGDPVLVSALPGPDGMNYFIQDRGRRAPIWGFALAFSVLVVLVGGLRGVWSLIGLAASFLVIVRFIIPAILAGYDPLLIAMVGALVIMAATLVVSHGVSWKTGVALGGTAISLLLTGVLAALGVATAHLTGIASDDGSMLQQLTGGNIDPRGLLLGGIIIGALGVLDDVTVTQSSTVFELRRANPMLGFAELYRRGMNVGRDHIASTVNTLVLAYAGAALPLLIILSTQPEPLGTLISFEVLATEIVRTLVGSIGIVAAVPITTALAAVGADLVPVAADDALESGAPLDLASVDLREEPRSREEVPR